MAVHSTTKPHLQKGFLIPLWTLQILVMLLIIISDIYLDTFTGFSPGAVILIMFCAWTLVVTIAEIVLFANQKLQPLPYLTLQIIMTTVWLVLLNLALSTNWQRVPQDTTGLVSERLIPSVLQPVLPLTLYVTTLIYASVIYHRYRRFDAMLKRTHSEAGLELVADEKTEAMNDRDGSTITGVCESDSSPIERSRAMETRQVQELGDEDFIKQLGGGMVKVVDCDREVHELAAARSRAASVRA